MLSLLIHALMPLTIIATPGAVNANSYVTVAQADAYMAARLNAGAWTSATADIKAAALIEAQRSMQTLPWLGQRTGTTQALAWPRTEVVDPDSPTGAVYADDIIPQRVQDAQIEWAFEFVRAGTTDIASADPSANIIREKVDVLEVQYAEPDARPVVGLARYPRVLGLLSALLAGVGGLTVVRR
jgi:hypothetical protein